MHDNVPQVLTVGTHNGYLHSFLASLPMVYDYNGTRVLYLTSLLEMTIMDVTRRQTVARIELESEPAFCGLGPSHAAMGMNNQVRALGTKGCRALPMCTDPTFPASLFPASLEGTRQGALMPCGREVC